MEIEKIRKKYQPENVSDVHSKKLLPRSACNTNANLVSFRQRIRANNRHNSIIAIARWAFRDAQKFDDGVKRLRSLIDGLEDISRVPPFPSRVNSSSIPENPPPYSAISPISDSGFTVAPACRDYSDFSNHAVMKKYLATIPSCIDHPASGAREKLIKLSDQQFRELQADVCDELLRRQDYEMSTSTPLILPPLEFFHPKRNEAREKLSTFIPSRFGYLIFDLACEFERRSPHLQGHVTSDLPTLLIPPRSLATRRWGYAPPALQYRAPHHSTIGDASSPRYDEQSPAEPWIPHSFAADNVEIFKSFRVKMDDTTSKVLPAALKKYHINASSEQYTLYVMYGDKERLLGMEEKPLIIFKQLKQAGKKPMFMLRKVQDMPSSGSI